MNNKKANILTPYFKTTLDAKSIIAAWVLFCFSSNSSIFLLRDAISFFDPSSFRKTESSSGHIFKNSSSETLVFKPWSVIKREIMRIKMMMFFIQPYFQNARLYAEFIGLCPIKFK